MDQQHQTQTPPPPTSTTTPAVTSTSTSQPSQPPPQQQQQEQPPPSSTTTTSTTTPTTTTTSNPNPNTKPTLTQPPPRPPSFSRPWQQPTSQQTAHFSHFSSLPSSSSSSPSSSASSPLSTPQRGGIAIGVPTARPNASSPQPTTSFSSSFGQPFGGLGRTGVNVPDSVSNSNPLQGRQQVQGIQGVGMIGSLGSSSQLRPGAISVQHHQQRPVQQSSLRPPASSSTSQPSATQSLNQPWLSSGAQGKPPLPPPSSYRPQMNPPSLQQRSHISQQHLPLSTTSQQQHVSSVQPQQPKSSHQLQESYGQQYPSSRVPQSLPHQPQILRAQAPAVQKPSSLAVAQPNAVQPATQSRLVGSESDESGNQILSKRSIHELVNQIDPSERLDPEVEDILVDIAEDFVESITTFGCSLAKHRKSDTLEAKDILLHVERNWNMTLPGFSGDEIKTYRKPIINDIHKERLAMIKKSIMVTEVANSKTSVGQAAVNAKSNLGKIL